VWKGEYERWSKRDLRGKEYVYLWADGVHFGVRLEDASQCILVVIGATADGKKELLAVERAFAGPETTRADDEAETSDRYGALGFWKALPQVFGSTRKQRKSPGLHRQSASKEASSDFPFSNRPLRVLSPRDPDEQSPFSPLFFFVVSSSCLAQTEKYPFQTGDGDLVSGLSWSPRNDLILTVSGDEKRVRGCGMWPPEGCYGKAT
jgi:hypothetical protein